MPRYFFHVKDGFSTIDNEGTELPDLSAARAGAIRMSGEILRDLGAKFWDGTQWMLEVADEGRQILFVLNFLRGEFQTEACSSRAARDLVDRW